MDHVVTDKQSCLNFMNYMDSVKDDLKFMYPHTKITNTRTIDELYDRHLINKDFYKEKRKRLYKEDKDDELQEMIYSMSFAAIIMTLFINFLTPNEFSLLKPFYFLYLFTIYILTMLFYYRKHHYKYD